MIENEKEIVAGTVTEKGRLETRTVMIATDGTMMAQVAGIPEIPEIPGT
jgi:hypothetical protein